MAHHKRRSASRTLKQLGVANGTNWRTKPTTTGDRQDTQSTIKANEQIANLERCTGCGQIGCSTMDCEYWNCSCEDCAELMARAKAGEPISAKQLAPKEPTWYIDDAGCLCNLKDLEPGTYQTEERETYLAIHIGEEEPGQGFRVDETYVLYLERPYSFREVSS